MNKRQCKKKRFGHRATKSKLKRRFKEVRIIKRPKTIFDGFGITDCFCPFCGCEEIEWSHNMASYPELYQLGFCARCGEVVAGVDNGPYHHILADKIDFPECSWKELQEGF